MIKIILWVHADPALNPSTRIHELLAYFRELLDVDAENANIGGPALNVLRGVFRPDSAIILERTEGRNNDDRRLYTVAEHLKLYR